MTGGQRGVLYAPSSGRDGSESSAYLPPADRRTSLAGASEKFSHFHLLAAPAARESELALLSPVCV